MKPITFTMLLILALALTAAGCASPQPQVAPVTTPAGTPVQAPDTTVTAVIPNLTGTWTGPMAGYEEGTGFTDYNKNVMSIVITEQQGRIFAGYLTVSKTGTGSHYPLAGVISRDGSSFILSEKENGYASGAIIAPDEIEITWAKDSAPFSVAIDTLRRG
jgi:hypothetical protein